MSNIYTSVKLLSNNILHRYIDENGNRHIVKEEFNPKIYIESQDKSKYLTLDGKNINEICFSGIKEYNEWIKQYNNIENIKLYGEKRHNYAFIADRYKKVGTSNKPILTYSIDIETLLNTNTGFPEPKFCREEISLITIHNSITGKMIGFGQYPLTRPMPNGWEYHECGTEVQLLKRFLFFWTNHYPDIVTHWNGRLFDMPYIYRRISMILGEDQAKRLSPYKYVSERLESIGNKDYYIYDIYGIESLDYLDLYKKFTYVTQENYKLDHIAFVELGERKVENPYPTFREFYDKDWDLFTEYCFVDTELLTKMEKKLKLIELAITIAYLAKCNFSDVLSPVKTWEIIIYNRLLQKNIITPLNGSNNIMMEYPGAYVKEPELGLQKWLVSFDFASMYPHICMQYGISPETLIEDEKLSVTVDSILEKEYDFTQLNRCITANGVMYKKDVVGILPELMQFYYNERVKVRKMMKDPIHKNDINSLDNAQMAYKILLNSLYGAAANQHFKYFDVRLAESITLTGQLYNKWVAKHLNTYLNKICSTCNIDYVKYMDTDSLYVSFETFVTKFCNGKSDYEIATILDKVAKDKILPQIDKSCRELSQYMNCNDTKMSMARENIASSAFWTAKKKYAMAVLDNDGKIHNPPKLKVMGLEIVRSSTPQFVRDSLKEIVELMLLKDVVAVRTHVKELKQKFYSMPVESIAFPRGVNNITKYHDPVSIVKSGCPIQVRAAILHNNFIRSMKLENKYPLIQDGDKIKFVYLKMPNTLRQNVIAWMGDLPPEFELDKYVDYDIMYEKVFLEPLKSMLQAISWELEERINLEDFF